MLDKEQIRPYLENFNHLFEVDIFRKCFHVDLLLLRVLTKIVDLDALIDSFASNLA